MEEQGLKIPEDIEKAVEKLIKARPELGYKTVREFVITACFLQILRTLGEADE